MPRAGSPGSQQRFNQCGRSRKVKEAQNQGFAVFIWEMPSFLNFHNCDEYMIERCASNPAHRASF